MYLSHCYRRIRDDSTEKVNPAELTQIYLELNELLLSEGDEPLFNKLKEEDPQLFNTLDTMAGIFIHTQPLITL